LYLSQKNDLSLTEIAEFFGGRHYTAVRVAHRRIGERRQSNSRFKQEMNQIEKNIA